MTTSGRSKRRKASSSSNSTVSPPRHTGRPMMSMAASSWRKRAPDLPRAAAMRPQLASWPQMAVLTSGEFATARAALSASASVAAPATCTVTRRVAPSPSAAIWRARLSHTAASAASKRSKAGVSGAKGAEPGGTARPLAIMKHESFVEVSESTVTLLKLASTARLSAARRSRGSTGASVARIAIIVAMFGMIMPEPFVMPPTEKTQPS